ncbi:MAG: GNAT family N-acetyltransferase [Candidatus Heimdallarchaeota archaeon]
MKIEKFSMKHYPEIVQLWKKAGISVGSSDSSDQIEVMLNRNPNLFLIGKLENHIVSVVMGGFDGRRGYVHHLAVDPEFQNRGFGKNLIEELINEFRKLGVHKIHLFIESANEKVVQFYLNLGWEIRDDLIMMSFIPDKNLYKMRI